MTKQNRQAVVIGVNEYKDPEIPRLWGAVNDADGIRRRLTELGEFDITEEHFLTNKKASGEAIRKAISDLLWKDDVCDLVLFYFSGHGFADGYGNGYIAPYDMLSNEPFVNGINMEDLKRLVLRSINKQCVIVILDCCFSGISAKGEKAISDPVVSLDAYFSDLEKGGEGKIIIASSGEDQKSREIEVSVQSNKESLIHGFFTYHLLEGLDGRAANEKGLITLDRLYRYIETQLISKGRQKPQFYAAATSQLEKIRIGIASEQFENYVREALQGAKTDISSNYVGSLFAAAEKVRSVLDENNDSLSALELREIIQRTLSDYKNLVMNWIVENELELKPKFSTVFGEFEKLYLCLDFEEIGKLDKRGKTQLSNLCQVSRGEMDMNLFIDKCRAWNNPISSRSS